MARNDLMGLAALGALGLMMGGKKSPEDASATPVEDRIPTPVGDEFYSPEGMGSGPAAQAVAAAAPVRRPKAAANTGPTLDSSRADLEATMTRGQRGDGRMITPQQAARRYVPRPSGPEPITRAGARYTPMSSADAMAALDAATGVRPMDPNAPRGPNAADSTELGRNLSNAMSAMTPGLSRAGRTAVGVAREFGPNSPVQRAYNAAAAARRAAEGYSPAEAQAAREAAELAAREGKTLNPNAWLAGPRGMAENFKKGGKVTKKVVSKPQRSSASSRADGIAQRGKTRGVMR